MHIGASCSVVHNHTEDIQKYSYIPVQRIASRCCFGKMKLKFSYGIESVTVVIPIPFKFCIKL